MPQSQGTSMVPTSTETIGKLSRCSKNRCAAQRHTQVASAMVRALVTRWHRWQQPGTEAGAASMGELAVFGQCTQSFRKPSCPSHSSSSPLDTRLSSHGTLTHASGFFFIRLLPLLLDARFLVAHHITHDDSIASCALQDKTSHP